MSAIGPNISRLTFQKENFRIPESKSELGSVLSETTYSKNEVSTNPFPNITDREILKGLKVEQLSSTELTNPTNPEEIERLLRKREKYGEAVAQQPQKPVSSMNLLPHPSSLPQRSNFNNAVDQYEQLQRKNQAAQNAAIQADKERLDSTLLRLSKEIIEIPLTYLPTKKSMFSSTVTDEPITKMYKEIKDGNTLRDNVLQLLYDKNPITKKTLREIGTNLKSVCFQEFLTKTLKDMIMNTDLDYLTPKIVNIAIVMVIGFNTSFRENIVFINNNPVGLEKGARTLYPKCDESLKSGASLNNNTNKPRITQLVKESRNLEEQVKQNATNISETPLTFLPTKFPFRTNTRKKALYRSLIPQIKDYIEEILLKTPNYNKADIKSQINSPCVKDILITYTGQLKTAVLSEEDKKRAAKNIARYIANGCNTSLQVLVTDGIKNIDEIINVINANRGANTSVKMPLIESLRSSCNNVVEFFNILMKYNPGDTVTIKTLQDLRPRLENILPNLEIDRTSILDLLDIIPRPTIQRVPTANLTGNPHAYLQQGPQEEGEEEEEGPWSGRQMPGGGGRLYPIMEGKERGGQRRKRTTRRKKSQRSVRDRHVSRRRRRTQRLL